MKKTTLLGLVFVLLILLFVFLFLDRLTLSSLRERASDLEEKLEETSLLLEEKERKLAAGFKGGIHYQSLLEKDRDRLVLDEKPLYALPDESSYELRPIWKGTMLRVIDKAQVLERTWYYVEIPVYDTPSDYKGWLPKDQTLSYTEDLESFLRGPLTIPAEVVVYRVDKAEDIKENQGKSLGSPGRGYLEERRGPYLRVLLAGGEALWLEADQVRFPPLE